MICRSKNPTIRDDAAERETASSPHAFVPLPGSCRPDPWSAVGAPRESFRRRSRTPAVGTPPESCCPDRPPADDAPPESWTAGPVPADDSKRLTADFPPPRQA